MNARVLPGCITIAVLLVGCAPNAADLVIDYEDGVAALGGTVTDSASGEPVPGAFVRIGWEYRAYTDRQGRFAVRGIDPGRYDVEVTHAWFHPESVAVDVLDGRLIRDVVLHRASSPCCDLLGEWTIDLALDSLGGQNLDPRAREISGRLWFAADLPHPIPQFLTRHEAPGASDEAGRFEIDFTPFWGAPLAPTLSTGVLGGGPDLLTEVLGLVHAGDSVMIILIPGLTHGGIELHGRIVADTVSGEWLQRATVMPGEQEARGEFVMHRHR